MTGRKKRGDQGSRTATLSISGRTKPDRGSRRLLPRGSTAIERVLARVEMIPIAGCWIFMGALNESGYGLVGRGARGLGNERTHRVTFEHFVGPIPRGLFVCHSCDVRPCCNPAHLFAGTPAENSADCRAKGRASKPPRNDHLRGERHYAAKLNDPSVRRIRALAASGRRQCDIADELGIGRGAVQRVVARRAWAHVN